MSTNNADYLQVAKKICGYFHMCSNGRASEVLEEISHLPKADVCRSVAQGTPSEDEDEDNEDDVSMRSNEFICINFTLCIFAF